jgi:environmental stress-induced protein Ves
MPWKNGGGETVEIAVSPDGATVDSFDWRISMARVDAPGPFSLFPGVDRTLAVIEGDVLELRFEGDRIVTLSPDSEPLTFPADIPVSAEILSGRITDLNVMTKRTRVRHALRRINVKTAATLCSDRDEMLVLVLGADCTVTGSSDVLVAAAGDAVLCRRATDDIAVAFVPHGPARLFVVELWRQ